MTRYLGENWLLPSLNNNNEAWFTAGKITLQKCGDCGSYQHPPEEICCRCQSKHLSFESCAETGLIESVAIVHHPVHPWLADHCPYAIVVVSLDGAPGVNVVGNIVNRDPKTIRIGQRVSAVYEVVSDSERNVTFKIPQWQCINE